MIARGTKKSSIRPRRAAMLAAMVAVGLALPAPALAQTAFRFPTFYGANAPGSVVAGDFDREGDLDLAVGGDDGVSIRLGGDGATFGAATEISAPGAFGAMAMGDFNGDSDPDLVVGGDLAVFVLLGEPGGSFGAPTSYPVPARPPRSIAVGDFNGDSDPDLALVGNSTQVTVLPGGGGGSFGAATTFTLGDLTRSVAVGDFNGDSDPDLAVTASASDSVSVLLGGAGAGFGAPTSFATGGDRPGSVAVGDFNGDSDPDLAVANRDSDDVSVLLGETGASFAPATKYPVDDNPGPFVVADLNGDRDPDLATVNERPSTVSVLFGGTGGSFAPVANFVCPNCDSLAAGDFDRDSDRDLAATSGFLGNLMVMLNNRAPVAAGDGVFRIDEDGSLSIPTSKGVLQNDKDPDGDGLNAVLDTGPRHGSVTLSPDGSFDYTPDPDFNGTDDFGYRANDGGLGGLDSGVATVRVDVRAVPDPPVADDDGYSIDEDHVLTVTGTGVLGNDRDADGDDLTATAVSDPGHGSLSLNADGSFDYEPDPDFNGTDTFEYRVSDGGSRPDTAAVSIDVVPVNDPPRPGGDSYQTDEDTPLVVPARGLLANDGDPEGDEVTASLDSGPAHGRVVLRPDGSFDYTPDPDFNGTDSFAYLAGDGSLDSDPVSVSIDVEPVNDPPSAHDDTYATQEDTPLTLDRPGVLDNDGDADGDEVTASLDSGPAHGRVELRPDGSFDYTPDPEFGGSDSFTYHAGDGDSDSAPATVTIDVGPVNDAPAGDGDSYTTDEDAPLTVDTPGVLSNDSDRDGDPLTPELADGPGHGRLELRANGSFTYTTDEDAPLTVDTPGVLANDSDRDGDPLTAELADGPGHGRLELRANGSFTYTPAADFNGSDSFRYRATDGSAQSDPVTVTIGVRPVDDPHAPAPGAATPAGTAPEPPGTAPAPAKTVPPAAPAISGLRLDPRCVRPSRSGRVRIRMTMRLAKPGPVRVKLEHAVGSGALKGCPKAKKGRRFTGGLEKLPALRPLPVQSVASGSRVTLRLRLKPGLYRVTVRAQLDRNRLSRPIRRWLRVLG